MLFVKVPRDSRGSYSATPAAAAADFDTFDALASGGQPTWRGPAELASSSGLMLGFWQHAWLRICY